MSDIGEGQAESLPADPDNAGWVMGWAALRRDPWSFGGIFKFEGQALHKAAALGADFYVEYGSHKLGSDDFIRTTRPNLGIDAELFQFMLEKALTSPGFMVSVPEIQSRLAEKLDRKVTVDEIERTVETTEYTQRDFQGRRTGISPYDVVHENKKLKQLKMPLHVAKNTSGWGWS